MSECTCNIALPPRLLRGVTRTVRITVVDKNGNPVDLTVSRNVVVTVALDGAGRSEAYVPGISIQGDDNNVVEFAWYADVQRRCGRYTIDINADFGNRNQSRVDFHREFGVELVEHSCDVSEEPAEAMEVDDDLDLEGTLEVTTDGMSAFDQWRTSPQSEGYPPTEEGFFAWMRQPATDAATAAAAQMSVIQGRADEDHARAGNDHTRAESDHGTASSDHTRAAVDHTQAGNDHTQAVSDHGTAADDHTLAASDHGTAASDHTLAASDHGTAATDHSNAVSDHSRAESDHSTAAADHTQATADHAVMAGYDTRLGNVEGKLSQLGNEEDIDQNEDGKLQFANRTYNAQQPNGMGYKILRKDATFASQVTDMNTIYEIRYNFNLSGGQVTIPSGSVLKFNGGRLSNGTVVGNKTIIEAEKNAIFLSLSLSGSFLNDVCFPEWWGAKGDGVTDDREAIQGAIDSLFPTVSFSEKTYLVSSTNPNMGSNAVGIVVSNPRRIIGCNTKRANGSYCIISFSASVSFDAGLLIDTAGVFVSNVLLQGANTYNVARMVSTSFDGTSRQELQLKNIKIDHAQNGIRISTYLSVLDSVRVSNITGDGIYVGDVERRCPSNEIRNCYVLDTEGIAYNIINCTASILFKCYTERSGYIQDSEVTEANSYPAYNIENGRGISLVGCGAESCAKLIKVKDSEAVTLSGCSFHGLVGDFATISGDLSQYALAGTLKGFAAYSCAFIGNADELILVGDNVVNVSFDSCVCYTIDSPSYLPLSQENLSRFDHNTMSIAANRGISVYDYDAGAHLPAKNISGSLGSDLGSFDKKYDFFGKKLTSSAGSQGSAAKTITDYKGELVIQFPGATSGNRVTFYADVNIIGCDKVVFKDMYTEPAIATRFKFTKSVVVFDSCAFTFVSGRAAFFTLSNCVLIFKNCVFNQPQDAPANFLLSAIDPTSTIIIEDSTGKYMTKDGKRGLRSVTTAERPASAPVGEAYYDETLSKPIWYTGSGWVDAAGTAV